ncbi:MAG: hypothetical protein IJR55_05610, partial [Clostridia bacterium]|nr:hypothetical protein [Clostridia bacterium]
SVIKPNTDPVPVQNGVAMIGSVVFDNVYDALKVVPFDETETLITLIGDCGITSNAGYTVNAKQNIVLDLNGHVLSSAAALASSSALITNKGTLTIKDSTDTAKNGSGKGKLTTSATNPDMQACPGYANNTITNIGTLTLESGTIEMAAGGKATYPVDNNSGSASAVFTMNGGHLYNFFTNALRMFCNSDQNDNIVVINGGIVEGYGALWMQNPNHSKANKGQLIINDGEFKTTAKKVVSGELALAEGPSNITVDFSRVYNYNTSTYQQANASNMYVTIYGGLFNENVWIKDQGEDTSKAGHAEIKGGTFNGYLYVALEKTVQGGKYIFFDYNNGTTTLSDMEGYNSDGYVFTDIENGYFSVVPAN